MSTRRRRSTREPPQLRRPCRSGACTNRIEAGRRSGRPNQITVSEDLRAHQHDGDDGPSTTRADRCGLAWAFTSSIGCGWAVRDADGSHRDQLP